MKPQSLSILVPGGCPNSCLCCCSKLHKSLYGSNEFKKLENEEIFRKDYSDAMRFTKDQNCSDLIFTGENGECLSNQNFMNMVVEINRNLPNPFIKCEFQTSGCYLLNDDEKYLKWLRSYVRIKIISLSLFDIYDSKNNALYSRPNSEKAYVDIEKTCSSIKKHEFTLRLSINMTNLYEKSGISPEQLFQRAIELGTNQITFRVLYSSDDPQSDEERKIDQWILENKCSDEYMNQIKDYIRTHGNPLERLSFGAIRYSVNGVSCVIDENCMSKTDNNDIKEDVKYLILAPDAHLYSKWNDKGSLLF